MTSCQTDRSSCHRQGLSAADWPGGTVSTTAANSNSTCGMLYHSHTYIPHIRAVNITIQVLLMLVLVILRFVKKYWSKTFGTVTGKLVS